MTQYEEIGFSQLSQMKDDYTTNSQYITYTFSFRKVGRMYFLSLGVKGSNNQIARTVDRPPSPAVYR